MHLVKFSAHPKSWMVSDPVLQSGPVESKGRVGAVLVLSDLFAQLFLHLPQLLGSTWPEKGSSRRFYQQSTTNKYMATSAPKKVEDLQGIEEIKDLELGIVNASLCSSGATDRPWGTECCPQHGGCRSRLWVYDSEQETAITGTPGLYASADLQFPSPSPFTTS